MISSWASKQMRSHRRIGLPGHQLTSLKEFGKITSKSALNMSSGETELTYRKELFQNFEIITTQYLDVLEDYLTENVSYVTICKWLAKKKLWLETQKMKEKEGKEQALYEGSDDFENFLEENYELADISTTAFPVTIPITLPELTQQFESGDYLRSLYSICSYLQVATLSSGFRLYSTESGKHSLQVYNPTFPQWKNVVSPPQRCNIDRNVPTDTKTTAAMHVALTLEPIVLDDVMMDERFLSGCDSSAIALMCLPIVLPNGDLIAVAEFHRTWHFAVYTHETLQMAESFFNCLSLAIVKSESTEKAKQCSEKSDFLLEVSKAYLDNIDNSESIFEHMTGFAKKMVNADSCTLLLHDQEKKELYSGYFNIADEILDPSVNMTKIEVRFPASTGIAGEAAKTKRIVVLADAYTDPRFTTDFDMKTGLKTKSIICVPMFIGEEVYGVAALTNEESSPTLIVTNKESLEKFAAIGALALKYSKIHSSLMRDKWHLEIAREQYLYHSRGLDSDFENLMDALESNRDFTPPDFEKFEFVFTCESDERMIHFVKMFRDIVPEEIIPVPNDVLARFIISVRKNCRNGPYHNWLHVMTATHTMYCILKRNMDAFTLLEKLSLLISIVCHDLDHQSLSNQYLQKIKHPLALLHPDSTLEYHHFDVAMDILSRDNHDILGCLGSAGREEVLKIIKRAILSTNLAYHFETRKQVEILLKSNVNLQDPTQKEKMMCFLMNAGDLSSTVKEFDATETFAFELHKEFWTEGDLCKALGLPVAKMMDRDLADSYAEGQIFFYNSVVIKCYETLSKLFPSCEPLAVFARINLERWQKEAAKVNASKEKGYMVENELEKQLSKDDKLGTLTGGIWKVEESRASN